MNGRYGRALGVLLLASQGAWASAQDVSGIACAGGELTVVTGEAFSARCTGDLRIAASSVIEAEASITLVAGGSLWMTGILSAPVIELTAYQDAYLAGGFFSGSPFHFPEVSVVGHAGSSSATLRTFSDIVAYPMIHPVYGAVTFTHVYVEPMPMAPPAEVVVLVLAPLEAPSPVPEPAMPLMFGLGAALLAWKRARMSRSAHRAGNPNVKLEN